MEQRKPQINFQVDPALKLLYDEAKAGGHWVTRLCAAGFLLMIEDSAARTKAIARLRDWEVEYADASDNQIRSFVNGVQDAMQSAAPKTKLARKSPTVKKTAKRTKSG